jgi:lincosamide nucleotidyltransferase A/C/D/E
MTAEDVLEALAFLRAARIPVWVDGGWGVDALLGEQTRDHADLDLAVPSEHRSAFLEVAARKGFVEVSAEPHNPVLRDRRDRVLDVHFVDLRVVRPGPNGRPVHGDIAYEVGSFQGTGTILGTPVACVTAEHALRYHSGYELDDNDIHDALALHRRFGIPLEPDQALRAAATEEGEARS